jgi:hypothetical protein
MGLASDNVVKRRQSEQMGDAYPGPLAMSGWLRTALETDALFRMELANTRTGEPIGSMEIPFRAVEA